jgi:hypothetical protein
MVNGDSVAYEYMTNPNKIYLVAMSEQIFNFLNGLLLEPAQITIEPSETGLFEYNLVRDYMKSLRFVNYKSEGRIKDTGAAMALRSAAKSLEPIKKAAAAAALRSRIH